MDWTLFLSTFSLIFVAELPDKTAFATLLMATRGNPYAIFVGVAAAFVIQSLVAVIFGSAIGLLPPKWVHLAAGILFLIFAGLALKRDQTTDEASPNTSSIPSSFSTAVWNSFLVIFIAEWGDLTQLATASLSARYHDPITIFTSAILALWSVTAIAIFAGNQLKDVVSSKLLTRLSAAAFGIVGLYFMFQSFRGV